MKITHINNCNKQFKRHKMKKNNLFIALLIGIVISAQSDNSFGIKAGANYSQFISDRDIYKGKIGYYVGGFFNFGISDKTSIRPELLFANQGTKTSVMVPNPNDLGNPNFGIAEANLNDLTILIPVSFRYKLIERLFVEAGLQVGYTIKRTEIFKKVTFDPSFEGQKVVFSDFDKFDLGLNGGIGFDLTKILEFHFRYSSGIIERGNSYKTSILSLGLGIKI